VLDHFVTEGKIRYAGVSNFSAGPAFDAEEDGTKVRELIEAPPSLAGTATPRCCALWRAEKLRGGSRRSSQPACSSTLLAAETLGDVVLAGDGQPLE
jgi:hypothetical protein